MTSFVGHALLGGFFGVLVAVLGHVATSLFVDEPSDHLVAFLSVGGAAGALAGLVVSLLRQRETRAARRLAESAEQEAEAKEAASKEQQRKLDKQLQRALKRWPSPFRHQLRARISPQRTWLTLSKSLVALLRRGRGDLQGQPVFQVFHPEDITALDQAFTTAETSRMPHSVEVRLLKLPKADSAQATKPARLSDTNLLPPLDPSLFVHVRLDLWTRRRPGGVVAEFWCLLHDHSPQRRAERALLKQTRDHDRMSVRLSDVNQNLQRLKESYRDLYHNAPVMFFSLDADGTLVAFNDTLNRTLGRTREELLRQPYANLLAVKAEAGELARRLPLREGELETQWRRRDGAAIDIWIRTVAVVDDTGAPTRFRSAALDLTEKNRLSHELRTRGNELERINQRLMHINAELEDFTHVVSHDLKEPLRTLQTYSSMLAEEHAGQLGADGFQYVNHLVRASRRLGTLIDELLNLGHAGRITFAPEIFDLNRAVATVRQDLVDLIQRKEATILTEGSLPSVVGDPHRIIQLLANLVANGLKYNQDVAPVVVIGVAEAEDPKQLVVWVRDNGIGIDAEHHDKIFGLFRRLHATDEYEGTGAGLAICKKIVEAHGGRIWVESQQGQGATFLFTLPRAPASLESALPVRKPVGGRSKRRTEPAAAAPATKAEPVSDKPRQPGGKPRIVLVEDLPEIGQFILKVGGKAGQQIEWFTTAEKAWAHLQTNRPDLLLCDIQLPGMDGIELCRRLRRLPLHQDTPIAIFSQVQSAEQTEKLRAVGVVHFISKDLLAKPRHWLKKLQELLDAADGKRNA